MMNCRIAIPLTEELAMQELADSIIRLKKDGVRIEVYYLNGCLFGSI